MKKTKQNIVILQKEIESLKLKLYVVCTKADSLEALIIREGVRHNQMFENIVWAGSPGHSGDLKIQVPIDVYQAYKKAHDKAFKK